MFHRWLYQGGHPNRLARLFNWGWAVLHSLGIAPNYMVTLEVKGRHSGRTIAFPLAMVVIDGARYIVSMLGVNSTWVKNVRAASGQVVIRHGRTEHVFLEEVPAAQRARILKVYLHRAPGARPHFPVDKDAPIEAFEAIADQFPVFQVLLANSSEKQGTGL